MNRNLEEECWGAHDDAKDKEDLGNRLKALDLLVKIRLAGERVKGDEATANRKDTSVNRAWKAINGGDV